MFHAGDVVDGRFEIVGPLGQGGMAHVFKAQDRHLDRVVALKVLRPHLTELDSERFRREIRALAQLSHPAIVAIFDLGLGEHVYFAMELIEGGTFPDLGPLEPDPEPLRKLLTAAIAVAEGLGYVHRLGMVHRDLTPRNILLTTEGAPKLMDFGLVQLTEASRQLTRTGFTLGTPQYMAPEQATGDPTGAATDLYAFGAVLYRTVTGVAPYEAENDQAVLYQHVYGSLSAADEVNPYVPTSLSALIGRLLQKDPAKRPASGYAVADALRSTLALCESAAVRRPAAGGGRRFTYNIALPDAGAMQRRWRIQLDEGPQWPSGMAAADGFLLIGLRSDALAVLQAADGGLHRTLDLVDEVSAPPLVHRDRVLVTSRDGTLTAYDWPRGDVLWHEDEADVIAAANFGGDIVLTGRTGLVQRRTIDGDVVWSTDVGQVLATPPTLAGPLLFAATSDGWLHALQAADGAPSYKLQVGPMVAPPTSGGGVLLIPEREGSLHGFDLATRDVLWSYDFEGDLWGGPAVSDRRVFVASWSQTVRCLSLATGDDLWHAELDAPVTASPVVAGGALLVATEAGSLHVYDARSGAALGVHRVSTAAIQASPLPVGAQVVVAALDGTVVAFG